MCKRALPDQHHSYHVREVAARSPNFWHQLFRQDIPVPCTNLRYGEMFRLAPTRNLTSCEQHRQLCIIHPSRSRSLICFHQIDEHVLSGYYSRAHRVLGAVKAPQCCYTMSKHQNRGASCASPKPRSNHETVIITSSIRWNRTWVVEMQDIERAFATQISWKASGARIAPGSLSCEDILHVS